MRVPFRVVSVVDFRLCLAFLPARLMVPCFLLTTIWTEERRNSSGHVIPALGLRWLGEIFSGFHRFEVNSLNDITNVEAPRQAAVNLLLRSPGKRILPVTKVAANFFEGGTALIQIFEAQKCKS